ncbi:MAG: Ppx/GppA family phosphatase [Deltaproteobacteria bacterium]|nr:Ppx/GppA family phosphatase [Deltaproteobacteria bacterium]
MRHASIDIGTNTLRLLIAEYDGRELKPLVYKRAITRLGGNYKESIGIDADSARRAVSALEEFGRTIAGYGVSSVNAVATSVVRRAGNRGRFIKEARERAGVDIEVISGDEEARLSLLGVASVIRDAAERRLVMDIGGGSTEFIFTCGARTVGAWSVEMGVVHLAERHLKSDPPLKLELECLYTEIRDVTSTLKSTVAAHGIRAFDYSGPKGATLIGTAGTITTLAAMDQDLDVYDRDRINNYTLRRERIRTMYEDLSSLTLKEREKVLALEKGREDLIIPGAAITLAVMDEFGFEEMKVSDAGLLEGVIIDRAGADQFSPYPQ